MSRCTWLDMLLHVHHFFLCHSLNYLFLCVYERETHTKVVEITASRLWNIVLYVHKNVSVVVHLWFCHEIQVRDLGIILAKQYPSCTISLYLHDGQLSNEMQKPWWFLYYGPFKSLLPLLLVSALSCLLQLLPVLAWDRVPLRDVISGFGFTEWGTLS